MDTSMSSYGSTKSRREMFEEQLKELQRDISNLSNKLSVPSLVTTSRMNAMKLTTSTTGSSSSADNVSMNQTQGTSTLKSSSFDSTQGIAATKTFEIPKSHDVSYLSTASHHSTQNILNMSSNTQLSTQDLKFQQSRFDVLASELKETMRQRDEAQRQLEQMKAENEELKRNVSDFIRLQTAYETLKHDHESLKVSFQSCERIRIQQKELIDVLQRSQVLLGGGATGGENASIASFNSMSTISHTAGGGAASQFTPQSSMVPMAGSYRSFDDNASHGSSVLPTVLSNINASMSHRTGTIPSANSSVSSAKPHSKSEHQDWLSTSVPAVVNVPRNRTPKGRSRSAGRPPRSSISAPSSQQGSTPTTSTPKRRAVTPTPSSNGKTLPPKSRIVAAVPQYLVSPSKMNASHISEASSADPFLSTTSHNPNYSILSGLSASDDHAHRMLMNTSPYPYPAQPQPQHSLQQQQTQPSSTAVSFAPSSSSNGAANSLKDPQQTSTMLTNLLLNQSPVRVSKPTNTGNGTAQKKSTSSSKKKMTRRSVVPSSTPSHGITATSSHHHSQSTSLKHTTHITHSSSSTLKKKTSTSKSNKEPLIDEKTGVRILYRAVSSPSSSFSKARRL